MFPNLAQEIENGEAKVKIDSVNLNADTDEKVSPDKLRDFNPSVIDFLRRCETNDHAESIIAFMENKGDLDRRHAERLRLQLRKEGVRSFGPKKEDGYYFKQGGVLTG